MKFACVRSARAHKTILLRRKNKQFRIYLFKLILWKRNTTTTTTMLATQCCGAVAIRLEARRCYSSADGFCCPLRKYVTETTRRPNDKTKNTKKINKFLADDGELFELVRRALCFLNEKWHLFAPNDVRMHCTHSAGPNRLIKIQKIQCDECRRRNQKKNTGRFAHQHIQRMSHGAWRMHGARDTHAARRIKSNNLTDNRFWN